MNKSALAMWVVVGLGAVASSVGAAPADVPEPPVADRHAFEVVSPNGNRRDDY